MKFIINWWRRRRNKSSNVLDWGADPLGRRDSSWSIQQAGASPEGGGTVNVPSGRYRTGGAILPATDIKVQGNTIIDREE